MYYWANNMDSFSYENMKASEIFDDCRNRLGMNGGECADTAYVIPSLPKKKTTFYDVVLDALSTTYNATGLRYYISSEKLWIPYITAGSQNMSSSLQDCCNHWRSIKLPE